MSDKRHRIFFILLSLASVTSCSDMGPELERPEVPSYPSDIHAAWSPDGEWIVYRHEDNTKYDSTYPNGLYLIDPDGNNKYLLLRGEAALPAWSPDAGWIAYTDGVLFKMKVELKEVQQLTNFLAFFPAWSPDGNSLAFDTPYQDPRGANVIWIIQTDGTGLRDISQHGIGEWRMPDWSPNGRSIVHQRYVGAGPPEIVIMDTSGQASLRLTEDTTDDRYPKWSPGGDMITWTKVLPGGRLEVWIMNKDGSAQRKLVDGSYGSFSADSRTIVFSAFDPTATKIVLWRIALDGSELRQLTH